MVNLSVLNVRGDASAGLLDDLRLMLVREGAPTSAFELKPASREHMSLGTIMGVDVETVVLILGAAGHIGSFAHCLWEWINKHDISIRVSSDDDTVDISPEGADLAKVAQIVLKMREKHKS